MYSATPWCDLPNPNMIEVFVKNPPLGALLKNEEKSVVAAASTANGGVQPGMEDDVDLRLGIKH